MKILIVEDDAIVALGLANEMQDLGYEVIGPANSVETALELADRFQPDMAFLDIDLERRGDGIIVARFLQTSKTSIVFVSGREDVARRHSDLAVGYIVKPYAPEDVADSVAVVESIAHGEHPPPPRIPASFTRFKHSTDSDQPTHRG